MDVRLILFILLFKSFTPSVLVSDETNQRGTACKTTQYIEFGKNGTVVCNAKTGVNQIHWYNSKDSLNNYPIISLSKGFMSGRGYDSGEYGIQPDGSLVFNMVLREDQDFKVVMLSDGDIVCEQIIHVLVFVKPDQTHPFIDKCDTQRYCHKKMYSNLPIQLSCSVDGAKPAMSISWELWTTKGFQKIQNGFLESDGKTSNFTITVDFNSMQLAVFVCRIESPAFELNSSIILVEWSPSPDENQQGVIRPTFKNVRLASKVKLDCGRSEKIALVWRKCISEDKTDCVDILHTSLEQKVIMLNEYDVTKTGELLIDEIRIPHGSWYWCLSSDGVEIFEKIYYLDIFALPNPPNLIVEECDGYQSCNINSGWEGNLTCSIFGVRPKANLQWVLLPMFSSEAISFREQKVKDFFHDDVYDITLRTLYIVENIAESLVEVECRATLEIAEMPFLSTRVELLLPDTGISPAKHPMTSSPVLLLTLCVLSMTVTSAVCFFIGRCCGRKGGVGSKKSSQDEENISLIFPTEIKTQEIFEKELDIQLSMLKMEIAQNLGAEEALRLSSSLQFCQEEQNSIESSKNPSVTLMNMLCNGSANSVMHKLAIFEVTTRKLEMTEINRVVDSFIRNHFRSTFMLKVDIAKDGKPIDGKETHWLWEKVLRDYSQSANIVDLQNFFQNEYEATTSSLIEGSLLIRLKISSAKYLKKLWKDIRSGELRLRISPFFVNFNQLQTDRNMPFELYITYDEKAYKSLQTKLQGGNFHDSEISINKENDENKKHKNYTTETPQTVLMGEILSLKLQIAEYIGNKQASDLCQQLGLAEERKKEILSSENPGLAVINFLFKKDGKSIDAILNVIIEATYQLKWSEVNYILRKFKSNFRQRDTNISTKSVFRKFAKYYVKTLTLLLLLSIGVTEAIIQAIFSWLATNHYFQLLKGLMTAYCPQAIANTLGMTDTVVRGTYFKLIGWITALIGWITAKIIPRQTEDYGTLRTKDESELRIVKYEKKLDEEDGRDRATLSDDQDGSDSAGKVTEKKGHGFGDLALQRTTEEKPLHGSRWKGLFERCNKIIGMAWITDGEPPFMEFEVSLLTMALSRIEELKSDLEVNIYDGSAIGSAGGYLTTVGVVLGPFTFGTSFTLTVAGITLSLAGNYLSMRPHIIHIHGRRCMRLNLSPVLAKLMRIVRALDDTTIILAKINYTIEQLMSLPASNVEQGVSSEQIAFKKLDELRENSKQLPDSKKPMVVQVENFCKTLEKLYIILKELFENASRDTNSIGFSRHIRKLSLDDAIVSIADHSEDSTRPLVQFLLMYYGILDEQNRELEWPDTGDLSGKDLELQKLKFVREKLSIQALKTSEIAKQFTENHLKEAAESPLNVSHTGVILSEPGTFIDFGNITKIMIDLCKGSEVELEFVFEQLQNQVAVINRISPQRHRGRLRTMYNSRTYLSDYAFSLLT